MAHEAGKEVRGNTIKAANLRNSKADWGYHPASGQTVALWSVLQITGLQGGTPECSLADADGIATASGTLYVAIGSAAYNAERLNDATARMSPHCLVGPVDTSTLTVGDRIYLSTTAGGWTATPPAGSGDVVRAIGSVKVVSATAGYFEFDGHGAGNFSIVP